jgi:hypothetical protein
LSLCFSPFQFSKFGNNLSEIQSCAKQPHRK